MTRRSDMGRHTMWLRWLSLSMYCVAVVQLLLLQAGGGPVAARIALVELLHVLVLLLSGAVSMAVALRHTAGIDRWAWTLIAGTLATDATHRLLSLAEHVVHVPVDPLLQAGGAFLAGMLLVGNAFHTIDHQRVSPGVLAQLGLDSTVIGVALLAGLAAFSAERVPDLAVAPHAMLSVGVQVCLLAALTAVVLPGERAASRRIGDLLLLGALCWLAAAVIAALPWGSPGTVVGLPLATLGWIIFTRGAVSLVAAPPGGRSVRQRYGVVTTAIPVASLSLVLVALACGDRRPPGLFLSLAFVSTLRAVLVQVRQRSAVARWRHALLATQRAHAEETMVAQRQVSALARLIHDQAAPMHGLWRVQRELTAASLGEINVRLLSHLDHLQMLVDQARTSLKGQRAEPALRRCRVDALAIGVAAVDAASERAALERVQLNVALAAGETTVIGDATAIRRILDNLITNALDVTPPRGLVIVELWDDRAHPGFLTISVRDAGPGLTGAQQAQIFEPRLRPGNGPGLGLGLAIVRELTAALGGACGVRSTPGAGSVFWVRLPNRGDWSNRNDHRAGDR